MSAVVDIVTEEVASNLEEAAAATRKFNASGAGFLFGGLICGLATGFYLGHRWNTAKIKAEALEDAEDEIGRMRDYYMSRVRMQEPKPDLEDVVEELGYAPVAPVPPAVENAAKDKKTTKKTTSKRPTKPPVPAAEPPVVDPPLVVDGDWDYAVELEKRTKDAPYVIHREEFKANDMEHSQVTYTYYDGDDVMVGEDERPIAHGDLVVGQDNLKWGHGSGDPNLVYVRNERLMQDMEICRSPASYEEEVLGLDADDPAS
jgi:hypothetical protein